MAQDDGKKALVIGGAALLLFLLLSGSANADEPTTPPDEPQPPKPTPPGTPPRGPGGLGSIPTDPGPVGPGGFGDLPSPPGLPEDDDPPLGEILTSYPQPGHLYQVKQGDVFLGTGSRSIVYRALQQAGYQAASAMGDSPEGASVFGQTVAGSAQNRTKYLQMILCSGWNDGLYGTHGFGGQAFEGPAGRSIRLLPVHANNLQRLRNKQTPIRNIQLRTPADRGKGNAKAVDSSISGSFELLWLPAINYTRLFESRGTDLTTEGIVWDGTQWPMTQPPPWVAQLGISVDESVNRTTWGCGLGEWVTE